MSRKEGRTAVGWKQGRAGTCIALMLLCWTGMAVAEEPHESVTEESPFYRNGSAPSLSRLSLNHSVSETLAALKAPLESLRVTSQFGWRSSRLIKTSRRSTPRFHYGIDYGAPRGTPVHVTLDGVIQSIGKKRGFGYYIRVKHENGVETAYAHMSSFVQGLARGDELNTGDVIGYVGTTGHATGPHLHYEVLVDGVPVDPENKPDDAIAAAQAAGRRFSAALP